MKSSLSFLAIGATLIVVVASGLGARAQDALDPRIAAYDKGPATIDVSTYPAAMKAGYKLFATRCSKCHTIARAINSEFVLEDEWERYVKRMMRKPGSGISANDGKTIYEFLAFDSKTRKKALYDKRSKGGK
jgi:cytochrome c5